MSEEIAGSPDLGELLLPIFPKILHAANSILENCTSEIKLAKKDGVILWIIATSNADERGSFAETPEIIQKYQVWFAAAEDTAGTQVARSKTALMESDLVYSAINVKRLYLTQKGKELADAMVARAKRELGQAFASLSAEQVQMFPAFVDLVAQSLPPIRKPAERERAPDLAEGQSSSG